jgi:hypothetical protein
MPDRLPSLVVLVGFWVPPAVVGWLAAEHLRRGAERGRDALRRVPQALFVLGYAALWFYWNLQRIPPYIPGSTRDPTFAPPEAVAGLAVAASALVLPGSALAYLWAFRRRRRMLERSLG